MSPGFRTANPRTAWTLIAGMRDKLIHAYDEVDLEEVFKTIQQDTPDLLARIQPLLPQHPG
ncbi:MAG: DUF86 domain-containing protein [Phycisphaerae bacterium]